MTLSPCTPQISCHKDLIAPICAASIIFSVSASEFIIKQHKYTFRNFDNTDIQNYF